MEQSTLTPIQQSALDKIAALLAIEHESGLITKRARNSVMKNLDPEDLACIAPWIIKFKQSLPPRQFPGNNSAVQR